MTKMRKWLDLYESYESSLHEDNDWLSEEEFFAKVFPPTHNTPEFILDWRHEFNHEIRYMTMEPNNPNTLFDKNEALHAVNRDLEAINPNIKIIDVEFDEMRGIQKSEGIGYCMYKISPPKNFRKPKPKKRDWIGADWTDADSPRRGERQEDESINEDDSEFMSEDDFFELVFSKSEDEYPDIYSDWTERFTYDMMDVDYNNPEDVASMLKELNQELKSLAPGYTITDIRFDENSEQGLYKVEKSKNFRKFMGKDLRLTGNDPWENDV